MSDQFVDQAKGQMGAIEEVIKGLPGISGYVDKELRRDADRRVRMIIVDELDGQKERLFVIQRNLVKNGGLKWVDDVDETVQALQILSDRVKTASYGYAGFFDPVRVREEQLDALNRFNIAMAKEVGKINGAVDVLDIAVRDGDPAMAVTALADRVAELNRLYDKRSEAIVAPDLLLNEGYAPIIAPEVIEAEMIVTDESDAASSEQTNE